MSAKKKSLSRFNKKYKIYCSQCSNVATNVTRCGNCDHAYCNECFITLQTNLMFKLFEAKFKSLPPERCTGQVLCDYHSELHPSAKMNIASYFEHLFDPKKIKCHSILCSAKKYCPNCLIAIKYQFCAECELDCKKYASSNHTYCKKCIHSVQMLHWIPGYVSDNGYKNEWDHAISRFPSEDHTIRWLCNVHCISYLHK